MGSGHVQLLKGPTHADWCPSLGKFLRFSMHFPPSSLPGPGSSQGEGSQPHFTGGETEAGTGRMRVVCTGKAEAGELQLPDCQALRDALSLHPPLQVS